MVKRVVRLKRGGVLTSPVMPESELMKKQRLENKMAVNKEITENLQRHNPGRTATMSMAPVRDDTDKLQPVKRSVGIGSDRPPSKPMETQTEPVAKRPEVSVKAQLHSERLKEVGKLMKSEKLSRKDAWARVKGE
jgi:hypothetical protein